MSDLSPQMAIKRTFVNATKRLAWCSSPSLKLSISVSASGVSTRSADGAVSVT
jgi:hypothetical protein